jgi:hypothetical protein
MVVMKRTSKAKSVKVDVSNEIQLLDGDCMDFVNLLLMGMMDVSMCVVWGVWWCVWVADGAR